MRMITAAKRLGLYSAFRAFSAMFFRSSLQPRLTVATTFCSTGTMPDGCFTRSTSESAAAATWELLAAAGPPGTGAEAAGSGAGVDAGGSGAGVPGSPMGTGASALGAKACPGGAIPSALSVLSMAPPLPCQPLTCCHGSAREAVPGLTGVGSLARGRHCRAGGDGTMERRATRTARLPYSAPLAGIRSERRLPELAPFVVAGNPRGTIQAHHGYRLKGTRSLAVSWLS
mmetsp:Transcript_4739/g.12230  ORF Transcript_4739/g.12230 Transcript_4739/m.12230 type:complete len:229 (+) Transcript_4739:1834-2520(+)